jgi:hypothetical protein
MSGQAAVALPRSSASTAAVIANLRQAISAQAPRTGVAKPPIALGLGSLDAALQGGLPRGKLVEVVGLSGKMSVTLRALAGATRRGELVALIDAADALDPQAAQQLGVDLARTLWVRVKSGKDGLKALDLLLGAGGFGLVAIYLAGVTGPAASLTRTDQVWPRLTQRAEKAGTTILCVADRPVTGSFAAVTLGCDEGQGIWESAPGGRLRLHSQRTRIAVQRSRLGPPGDAELLTLRK